MKKWIFILTALLVLLVLSTFLYYRFSPYPDLYKYLERETSVQIYSEDGVVLQVSSLADGLKRECVSLEEIPEEVQKIFLLAEDNRFYYHLGVDIIAVIRAAYLNILTKRRVSGASTITMQLADIIKQKSKPRQTFLDKIVEASNSLKLEARFSKKEILEMWFNSIYFGKNCEGIASATKIYFSKNVSELTTIDSILLANILKNPTKYNPTKLNKETINAALILSKKLKLELTQEDFKKTILENKSDNYQYPFVAPHFIKEVNKIGNKKRVNSTLNFGFQEYMNTKLKETLDKSKSNRIKDGAIVVVENSTGNILVYIGSPNFFDKNSGQIDGVQLKRQPGSTLKPFLYSLALENGWSASTILPDVPQLFGGEEIYQPENYNNRFNGPVRLRVALASSLNIPAIWSLEKLGVANFINFLIDLEFNSIKSQRNNLGLGLAVGNGEVTLLELTRAFTIFANGGELVAPKYVPASVEKKRVISQETAAIICDILGDNSARVLGFGNNSVLNTEFKAIFKTGTSNQFNNIWAVGSTPEITCGVWLGNFSGETVVGVTGSYKPAMLVREALSFYGTKKEFPKNENIISKKICALSGKIPTDNCSICIDELFKKNDKLEECDYHKNNNEIILPHIYDRWKSENFKYNLSDELIIESPKDRSTFYIVKNISLENQTINIVATANKEIIELFINKKRVETAQEILKYNLVPTQLGPVDLEFKTKNQTKKITIILK